MTYWLGILFCLSQSAIFSGLTIGLFGLSRLRLEVEAAARDRAAIKVLKLRSDSNYLLATLLWGNVAVNVLLTMLTESVLSGLGAFVFSTVAITLFGEIAPQAYLSRNAIRVGVLLIPLVRFYQIILFPITKPTAMVLDLWLGRESVDFLEEKELQVLIRKHMKSEDMDICSVMKGLAPLNFLLDDMPVSSEGEVIHPESVISLPVEHRLPIFPKFKEKSKDPFLQRIQSSNKKWVIITDEKSNEPVVVLDADGFLRHTMFEKEKANPYHYCHRPVVVTSESETLGKIIPKMTVMPSHDEDDVIDHDIILFWGKVPKIITGSDILGRLLRNIVCEPTHEK